MIIIICIHGYRNNLLYYNSILLCIPSDAGRDYQERSSTLRFNACGSRSCMTITITNDVTVEQEIETFFVSLSDTSEDNRIRVNTHPSPVCIMDNDGMLNRKLYM